jgi:hypothetical protein
MNIQFYSYAHTTLSTEILKYQSLVFNKYGYKINQIVNDKTHSENIEYIIRNVNVDCIVIFDIDCIPLTQNLLFYIKEDLVNNDLIGAVGCANHLNKDDMYVHPSFMFFKPQLYFKCGSPFLYDDYNNDVAQNFTRSCIKNNKKIKYWFNTYSSDYIWDLPNNTKFGHGTVYEGKIYHQFEIRKREQHENFIKKCNEILNYEL